MSLEDKQQIISEQNRIDEEIKKLYGIAALDGITDIDQYLKSGRILWILKETGKETNAKESFDNRKKLFNMQKDEYQKWKNIWKCC